MFHKFSITKTIHHMTRQLLQLRHHPHQHMISITAPLPLGPALFSSRREIFSGGTLVRLNLRFSKYLSTASLIISSLSCIDHNLSFIFTSIRFSIVSCFMLNLLSDSNSVNRLNALSTVEFDPERDRSSSTNRYRCFVLPSFTLQHFHP